MNPIWNGLSIAAVAVLVALVIANSGSAEKAMRRFLDGAVVDRDLLPGAPVEASIETRAGLAHEVWLDLDLDRGATPVLRLAIAIRVGGELLVDEVCDVDLDDGFATGLPDGGVRSAVNTTYTASDGKKRYRSAYRIYRLDPKQSGLPVEVRATCTLVEGTVAARAHLLVTVGEAAAAKTR